MSAEIINIFPKGEIWIHPWAYVSLEGVSLVADNDNTDPQRPMIALDAIYDRVYDIADKQADGWYNVELLEDIIWEECAQVRDMLLHEISGIDGPKDILQKIMYRSTEIPHIFSEIQKIVDDHLSFSLEESPSISLVK